MVTGYRRKGRTLLSNTPNNDVVSVKAAIINASDCFESCEDCKRQMWRVRIDLPDWHVIAYRYSDITLDIPTPRFNTFQHDGSHAHT